MRLCTLLLFLVVFVSVCAVSGGGRGNRDNPHQRSRGRGPPWGEHHGGGRSQGRNSKKPRRPGGQHRAPPPDTRTRQGGHPQSGPRAGFSDNSLFQFTFGDGEQSSFSFSSDDISSLWDQVFGNSDSDGGASVATSTPTTTTTTTASSPTAATASVVAKPWRGRGSFTGDLRLSCKDKGCLKRRGVVEVYNREEDNWGVICASKWNLKDARVVCNYLQYSKGAKKFIRMKRSKAPKKSRHLSAFYSNVNCTGKEAAITECRGETVNTLECPKNRIAAVVCLGKVVDKNVPAVCNASAKLCANQGRCIQPGWVCDGMSDCPWGTDERNCGEENCNPSTFWCGVGGAGCISKLFVCDGDDDCTNNRDEINCDDHLSHFTTTAGRKLPNSPSTYETGWRHASPFMCAKKCREETRFQCVSFDYNKALSECDMSTMSSRRLGLVTPSTGAANWVHYEMKSALNCAGFVCGDQCIPSDQVCDGVTQCLDGTDEQNCPTDGGPIPTDVIIRLKGGTSRFEGRLEIGTHSDFGLICDVGWTIREANVACRQLGFRRGALKALKGQFFARTSLPYKLSGVRCTGTEAALDDCQHSGWNQATCAMDHEAGVVCMTIDHLSHFTTTGGRKLPNSPSTYETGWRHASPLMCAKKCREETRFQCVSFDYNKALRECDMSTMSSRRLGLVTPSTGAANWVHYEMKSALNCAGFVCGDQCIPSDQVCDRVTQCLDGTDEQNCPTDGGPIPTDVIIRLKGGTSRFEGRLEIGTHSDFGLICDVGWTIREAKVACRQLGFRRGALKALKGQFFARTSLPYKLSGVRCNGTEAALDDCQHSGWNQATCAMDHEAGVVCMTRNTVTAGPTSPVTTARPTLAPATGEPPAEPTCGNMSTQRLLIRPRVVGGSNADPGEWPWQVGIWLPWMFKCGGTLISSCWVLTAAHCFTPHYSASSYIIRLGNHDAKRTESTEQHNASGSFEQRLRISQIIFNRIDPYDSSTNDNDIALLELEPIRGGTTCATYNEFVKPACIPTSTHQFPADHKCYITGWGQLSTTEQIPFSRYLQEAPVPLISKQDCARYTVYGSSLSANMFCAGYLKGGIDTCQGDSGGPLQCYDKATERFYVWGIVSWGHGCANSRAPGIYTTVANYVDWIRRKTGLNL